MRTSVLQGAVLDAFERVHDLPGDRDVQVCATFDDAVVFTLSTDGASTDLTVPRWLPADDPERLVELIFECADRLRLTIDRETPV